MSKSDAFLAGKYKLTPDEMAEFKLVDGKGNRNSCHLDGTGTTLKSGQTRARIAPAQRRRWAKVKAKQAAASGGTAKRNNNDGSLRSGGDAALL